MKKQYYLLMVVLLAMGPVNQLRAQNIISVAGVTTMGYNGDDGRALYCELHWPEAIALDASGQIYIADGNNNVIRKIDGAGIITTVVGSGFEAGTGTGGFGGDAGPATAARLYYASGVAFDAAGNMYIADKMNHRIRIVDPTGNINTFAGTGVAGFGGDGAAANAAKLNKPTRVTVDAAGNVYIADAGNHCIRKVDASGVISTIAGVGGSSGFLGDGGPANVAKLNNPIDMTVDPTGNLFIADNINNRIRKVDGSGNISTYAGIGYPGYSGDSAAATNANIFQPSGIVSDAAGNIFFSDFANARVRRIDAVTGIITTFAGNGTSGYGGDGGPAKAAEIYFPQGLAVNTMGGVYIADKANNRVRYASKTLGTEALQQQHSGIGVYPNPNNGVFTISIASGTNEPVSVTITNCAGQKVNEFRGATNQPNELRMDVPPGIYFISAVTSHGVQNEKVVIR